jgi:alpha-D-ribose 1-methylphosphonate 5-triphosphate diphosphatase PhnM
MVFRAGRNFLLVFLALFDDFNISFKSHDDELKEKIQHVEANEVSLNEFSYLFSFGFVPE